jgi:hypothetical protein
MLYRYPTEEKNLKARLGAGHLLLGQDTSIRSIAVPK